MVSEILVMTLLAMSNGSIFYVDSDITKVENATENKSVIEVVKNSDTVIKNNTNRKYFNNIEWDEKDICTLKMDIIDEEVVEEEYRTGLQQEAMYLYKECVTPLGEEVEELINGIYVYDGIPWESTGAYTLDLNKVDRYIYDILGDELETTIVSDYALTSSAIDVDGIQCADFAAPSILAFKDIDEFGNVQYSSKDRPKKCCAILTDEDGKTFYLPLSCVNDAKAHTWPGGICQTFLLNTNKANGWCFSCDGERIEGSIIGTDVGSLSDIRTGYKTVTYNGGYVTPQLNLEVNKAIKQALVNKGYKLIGFIAWKE